MQSKLEPWEPMIMAGRLAWLLSHPPSHRWFAVRQWLAAQWANGPLDLGARPAVVVPRLGLAIMLAGAARLWGPSRDKFWARAA